MTPDPSALPLGRRCATHFEQPAVGQCLRCNVALCLECRLLDERRRSHCATCLTAAPELARRGSRLAANMVDQFLPIGALIAFALVQEHLIDAPGQRAFPWLGLLAIAALLVLQAVLVHRTGQSLGKRLVKIRVVRSDGSAVSLARVLFVRTGPIVLVNYACGLVALADVLFIFGTERRCLHDLIADTKVVSTERALSPH
jgi:uncharacterized RDD family membrane protein YckC